jgi:acyl carrier protein
MKKITIEEFIEKIEEEFPEMPKGHFKPETKFREEMDWDSVNALVFIAMVNVEYDVALVADEFVNAYTIQDVYDVVKRKVEEREEAIAKGELTPSITDEESKEVFMGMKESASNKENELDDLTKSDNKDPEEKPDKK